MDRWIEHSSNMLHLYLLWCKLTPYLKDLGATENEFNKLFESL